MDGELFGQMIDAVGVGVGVYNDTGRYVYVNQAYADLLETDRESLFDRPIWEVNDAFDPDQFDSYWNSFGDGETKTAETVHELGETAVDVQTVTTRVETPKGPYNVGTIQDISIQKRRERQLSQLHTVTDELIEADSVDEIARVVSETAEQILDFERTVVRIRSETGDLEPVFVTEGARADMGESWSYGLDEDTDAVRAYTSGEVVVVDDISSADDRYDRGDTASIMYLPIGSYGLISIAHHEPDAFDETDVDLASILASNAETAFRRLETESDLRRKNERLEAFVDVITHDIPNHLNVAESRVSLAREDEDLSHLEPVSTAHGRIESVISDMHTLVDHGEQIDSTTWVRLADIADGCWRSCRQEETSGTLELAETGYVRADESRFKQLLENLFWNALEHAGSDPTVRVGLLDGGFFVEDDGPGIPESNREKVLTPGFTEAENGHSGFGLAIVQEIARAHGWEVTITGSELDGDEDGPGARFEFTNVTVRAEHAADSP
jgi:PAS domain S-box-containing protein